MCGINGIIRKDGDIQEPELSTMNRLINHRGPDENGSYFSKGESYSIGMAMTRLAIIDVGNGSQPMHSRDGRFCLVFNGEIYNFRKLKCDLEREGVSFKTDSDTEVVLELFIKYHSKAFQFLDGMYALSIHDKEVGKVYIARDFFGEKPLFYKIENGLIWGSELKSVTSILPHKPKICPEALRLFFSLTYIPAPYTIYDNIFKLEPNTCIEYDLKTHDLEFKTIHDQDVNCDNRKISFEHAKCKTRDLVNSSVASRSYADVPLGCFLSGGVDSSIVAWSLSQSFDKKIDTFSIGFTKKQFDETSKSRTVADLIGSNHHELILEEKDLIEDMDEILLNFDEPFADASSLPTYLVSKLTSQHLKVALTGDGGDEVFGGYNKYYMSSINKWVTSIIPKPIFSGINKVLTPMLKTRDDDRGKRFKMRKLIDSVDYDENYYWNIISLGYKEVELNRLFKDADSSAGSQGLFRYFKNKTGIISPKNLHECRAIDKHVSLEGDMLVKVDRTSMLNSIECRAPFLNKELWDFTRSLPQEFLLNKSSKKHLLKKAFENNFPAGFLEKSKQGFGVPVGDWLRGILATELISYIQKDLLEKQNIFNTIYITNLVERHLSGREDSTFKVWSFYCFQKWYFKIYEA